MEKIAIASDHAGFELKEKIKVKLIKLGFEIEDFGCDSTESVDYPDYAKKLSESISKKIYNRGVLICGSGTGMSIVANKFNDVRAANCWTVEVAELARSHNDINVLCMGARILDATIASNILSAFLKTKFEGGRHLIRVSKINQ